MYNKKAKHAKNIGNTTNKKSKTVLILLLIALVFIPISFCKYTESLNKKLTLNIRKPNYTVKFYSNRNDGEEDEITTQNFVYGTKQKLTKNIYTKSGNSFKGWNTKIDGSGTTYIDEQEVDNLYINYRIMINIINSL